MKQPSSSIDTEKLLIRLHDGGELSKDELEEIRALLNSAKDQDSEPKIPVDLVYSYLVVLSRAKAADSKEVLERFLNSEDSLTVALVLDTLCMRWGGTEEYLEQLISFSLGAIWDSEEDVRQTAIFILGEYLHDTLGSGGESDYAAERREKIIELLLDIFESDENEDWIRQSAYRAVCRAAGRDWEQLPTEGSPMDLARDGGDIDCELLDQMRKNLAASEI